MSLDSFYAKLVYEDNMREKFVDVQNPDLPHRPVESEDTFLLRIAQECRRAERSRNRFVLVLVQGVQETPAAEMRSVLRRIFEVTRETDTIGWYQAEMTLGVLFAELGDTAVQAASNRVFERISGKIKSTPGCDHLEVSAHILPRDLIDDRTEPVSNHVIRFSESFSSSKHLKASTERAIKSVVIAFPILTIAFAVGLLGGKFCL